MLTVSLDSSLLTVSLDSSLLTVSDDDDDVLDQHAVSWICIALAE
jgi:hypothetical protein